MAESCWRSIVLTYLVLFIQAGNAAAGSAAAGNRVSFSGIYPHLAMFNSQGECGIGAVVLWQDRLWAITYSPHCPNGSDDKLCEITPDLAMIVRPESIGGTPANRMIHRESDQLIIGPYFINRQREVRAIGYDVMPGRLTATARHLADPARKVYMVTMEEGLYAVDVQTLAVNELFQDGNALRPKSIDSPHLPGYHGKGGYSGQGLLVYANNGEWGSWRNPLSNDPAGCLAQWDGTQWSVVQRAQFTEVTGPGGIEGNQDAADPIWSTGWDHRSVILELLDHGRWLRFRLPKASHTYDARHGWYTEWPRIRTVGGQSLLMTMHGMFFQFPKTFSAANRTGIRPRSSYLKMVSDWERFSGKLVFACDDASKLENPLCGQSQSNLWFVDPQQLDRFGPREGYGGVWVEDAVKHGQPSDPYLLAGYDRRAIHIAHRADKPVSFTFEVDRQGDGHWSELLRLTVRAKEYLYHVLDPSLSAPWIRVTADTDCNATVYFHYSAEPRPRGNADKFVALAGLDSERTFGVIRPRGANRRTLQFAAWRGGVGKEPTEVGYYEIGADMKLCRSDDVKARDWLSNKAKIVPAGFKVDKSSIVFTDKLGRRWRLPRGTDHKLTPHRMVREVITERSLLNCGGSFFELPRESAGGIAKIRPICTHRRAIHDFCSWRGMLVLSGCLTDLPTQGNYVASDDGKTGLWFGTVDDLWTLGKPRGRGGPWRQTAVQAGTPSDPYLMVGYDRKTLMLSHDADQEVTVSVEVDILGGGPWHTYDRFTVKPNAAVRHQFPDGFSARWVRLKCDHACRATGQLIYD